MASTGEGRKNIVPCLVWVKQGCAKRNPDKITLEKEELKKIIEKTQSKIEENEEQDDESNDETGEGGDMEDEEDDFASEMEKAKRMAASIKKAKAATKKGGKRKHDENEEDDFIKRYGLAEYDDDDTPSHLLHGIGGLTPFASNEEDPYITLKEEGDSDDEDFELKPTDNLIALGRVTEEAACMEVHIYNGDMNNLFIHHDYILPTFPIVLEWMDYDIADGEKGNFVAMGTMEPEIGIWDLDVVDSLEPVATLEAAQKSDKKKKKKLKKKETLSPGHTDAVLDLSWNSLLRNVLASASADQTVCLWDLSQGKVVSTLSHHDMQVQCVAWHPVESQSLLTGSFDNYAAVIDCRNPTENVKKWKFQGEVERAMWNHFSPFSFLASTDEGMIYEVDVRNSKPLFTLSAHEQSVTGMCLSSQIPGLLVTVSPDKHFKVWDIQDAKPTLVFNRNIRMDVLHSVACNPDHPFVFGVGANKDFKVWDIRESAAVRRHFLSRMPVNLAQECEADDGDLPLEDSAADALANLNMEDEEDLAEEEEMMAGDVGRKKKKQMSETTQPSLDGSGKKKKKKKKKKRVDEGGAGS